MHLTAPFSSALYPVRHRPTKIGVRPTASACHYGTGLQCITANEPSETTGHSPYAPQSLVLNERSSRSGWGSWGGSGPKTHRGMHLLEKIMIFQGFEQLI